MMSTTRVFAALLMTATFTVAGCKDPVPASAPTPPPAPPPAPPTAMGGNSMEIAPPPPGTGTGATGMRWQVPAGWQQEPPANRMRKAQYRVKGAAGDAEVVVFYFGPGQGGDAMANATRWAGQFKQADGSSGVGAMKTTNKQVNGINVLTVEVAGAYSGGMGPMMQRAAGASAHKPGYKLLGAVARGADANWFFKMTGPEATVEAERAAFDSLLNSLAKGS